MEVRAHGDLGGVAAVNRERRGDREVFRKSIHQNLMLGGI